MFFLSVSRYVREWLNSMVVGDIVEATEDGHKYWLPKERRQMLLSGNQNLAVYFPLFTNVFDPIVSCFKLDGPSGMVIKFMSFKKFFIKLFFINRNALQRLFRVPRHHC